MRGERKLGTLTASLLGGIRSDQPKRKLMMKRTMSLLGIAGCALAAGSLYAATYSESFENTTDGSYPTTEWSAGSVTNNGSYSAPMAGFPLTNSVNHTKVLLVEGDATCTPTSGTGSGKPLVDMMVQASRPDEELELPEGEGPVHIAVAVDSNGYFNVYCTKKSDGSIGWSRLSNTVYDDAAWARVSLLFDYSASRCQVRIDGEPMMTADGYIAADRSDATGAWYELATNETQTTISALKIIGCTAVDDVLVDNTENVAYSIASTAVTNGVSCAWLDQYGLGWDSTTAGTIYDSTGMTVAQKYNACLSPFDDQKFEVKSMAVADNNGTATVTVGIPEFVTTTGRKVVIDYGTDSTFSEKDTADVPANQSTVNITAPAGDVIYYRLRATTTAAAE